MAVTVTETRHDTHRYQQNMHANNRNVSLLLKYKVIYLHTENAHEPQSVKIAVVFVN